jgi:hypothetical protein
MGLLSDFCSSFLGKSSVGGFEAGAVPNAIGGLGGCWSVLSGSVG